MNRLSGGRYQDAGPKKPTKRTNPGRTPAAEKRAQRRAARERFAKARIAEKRYAGHLRHVARQTSAIVRGYAPAGIVGNQVGLRMTLSKYAEILTPWAQAVAGRMIAEVDQRDASAWAQLGRELGRGLQREIVTTQTGALFKALMNVQVDLIKSIPLKEAERVHDLTIEQMGSSRADEIAKEILRTNTITSNRAKTIARTEVARTASSWTEARAVHVGSTGYIWRTAGDSDVRHDHRRLEGQFIKWNDPPISDIASGVRAHAGCIYNCRCYPEPVIPDVIR